jgi:hypothetical protein
MEYVPPNLWYPAFRLQTLITEKTTTLPFTADRNTINTDLAANNV